VSETRVLAVGDDPEHDSAVLEAAESIRAGDVVAFPTETVYGLGADATSPEAVERIYRAKRRPADNPAIVHVLGHEEAGSVVRAWTADADLLAGQFWPGPLTLILPAADPIARAVGRGLTTVGVRAPAHPVARALLRLAARPIAAPSANLSGRPSPTTAGHVLADLGGRIPLVLDGGPCAVGLESTVLDITGPDPVVLRPGTVTREQIEGALGRLVRGEGADDSLLRSPGTRYRHYAPSAPVVIARAGCSSGRLAAWAGALRGPIGYVGWRREVAAVPTVVAHVLADDDAARFAAALYAALRELDARGVEFILCDEPERVGIGVAVAERLGRAASLVFEPGADTPTPRTRIHQE
jgi:L-threonylcarbamoyladenylate synthase